nr:MAG: hypothetical protein B6I27_01635 [Erwiniaceae bacterium 4572_131]
MNTTNKQTLKDFRVQMLSKYTKIEIKTSDIRILTLNKTNDTPVIVEYTKEINQLRATPLSKWDIINLKKFAKYNSYWLDLQKNTISINGIKNTILKVKDNLYFRNTKTGALKNATKLFTITKKLNSIKAADLIINKLIQNQEGRINKLKENHKVIESEKFYIYD